MEQEQEANQRILQILQTLVSEVSGIKGDIVGMKEDIAGLKEDFAGLKEDFAGMKEDFAGMKENFAVMKGEQKGTNMQLEFVMHQLEAAREEQRDIKLLLRDESKKLQKVYESRDKVTVNFTKSWAFASFCMSIIGGGVGFLIAK
jgi:chromosome segregation ATPase